MREHRDLAKRILGLAIELHRQSGAELVESVYAKFLGFELEQAGAPVFYQDMQISLGFRGDILVPETVALEIKAIAGLLINFRGMRRKDGLKRFVASQNRFLSGPSRPSSVLRVENGGRMNRLAGAVNDDRLRALSVVATRTAAWPFS